MLFSLSITLHYCWHLCWHHTILQFSYHLVQLLQYNLTGPAHNFCLTVHLLDSSETPDYSWDLWIKHTNKMTFPHPVWMSWRLIPSKAASPYDIQPAIPPPHLCPQTPQSRAELSPARLPWWWEEGRRAETENSLRSDADGGQRAGLQNTSQREAHGALNTSGSALVTQVLTNKTDGWIFHEYR